MPKFTKNNGEMAYNAVINVDVPCANNPINKLTFKVLSDSFTVTTPFLILKMSNVCKWQMINKLQSGFLMSSTYTEYYESVN